MASRLGTSVFSTGTTGQSASVNHTLLDGLSRKVRLGLTYEHDSALPPTGWTVEYGGVAATLVSRITWNTQKVAEVWEVLNADLPANGVNLASAVLTGGTGVQGLQLVVDAVQNASQSAPTIYTNTYSAGSSLLFPSGAAASRLAGQYAFAVIGCNGGTPATNNGSASGAGWGVISNQGNFAGDFNQWAASYAYAADMSDQLTVTFASEVGTAGVMLVDEPAGGGGGGDTGFIKVEFQPA